MMVCLDTHIENPFGYMNFSQIRYLTLETLDSGCYMQSAA